MSACRPLLACLPLLASLGACSPAMEWRDMRPPGAQLRMAMPCRPDSLQREVALAGATVPLTLMACQVEGAMFAVSYADVGEPSRVGPVLVALAESARRNLQGQVESEAPAQVAGMTPQPAARRLVLSGHMPDGRALTSHTVLFSHGTRVFQATVMGEKLQDQAVRTFIEGLAVQP